MKRLTIFLLVLLALAACKRNSVTNYLSDTVLGPEYCGEYLDKTDVRRIAAGLNVAPDRKPTHWDNPTTGYQYSMTVFSTQVRGKNKVRIFSVLSTAADGAAEVLYLEGASAVSGEWKIHATRDAAKVGKATKLAVKKTDAPKGTISSGDEFPGFVIIRPKS